jgi:uncharacterized protein (TIGR01244 family)
MLKHHTQKLGNAVRRMRGDMTSPVQRLLGHLEMLFVDHGFIRVIYSNTHRVSPRMFRSAQLTPGQIERAAARGIKTIINLRGQRDCGSYLLQKEICARHGIAMIDFPISSRDAPRKTDLRDLKDIFARIEYPALMHCKSGADRAGLGAALYLALAENRPLEEATAQLHWKYGHLRQAKTGILDHFFETYRKRNAAQPIGLLEWTEGEYDPEALKKDFHANRWANLLIDRILRRE